MWSVWDKTTDINGVKAEVVFSELPFLSNEEAIFLETDNGVVTNIEGKSILAYNYGIDSALPNEEFIEEYERLFAEMAQAYKEGVNSIDE